MNNAEKNNIKAASLLKKLYELEHDVVMFNSNIKSIDAQSIAKELRDDISLQVGELRAEMQEVLELLNKFDS